MLRRMRGNVEMKVKAGKSKDLHHSDGTVKHEMMYGGNNNWRWKVDGRALTVGASPLTRRRTMGMQRLHVSQDW